MCQQIGCLDITWIFEYKNFQFFYSFLNDSEKVDGHKQDDDVLEKSQCNEKKLHSQGIKKPTAWMNKFTE